jgi:hypothetical protein
VLKVESAILNLNTGAREEKYDGRELAAKKLLIGTKE